MAFTLSTVGESFQRFYLHYKDHSDLSVKPGLEGSKTGDNGIIPKTVQLIQGTE